MKLSITISILLLCLISCTNSNKNDQKSPEEKSRGQEMILGERINGPANIRATANGRLLFSLNHETRIQTGMKEGKWLEVGLFADNLTEEQLENYRILPNERLFLDGIEVGKSLDTVEFWMTNDDEKCGFIAGMTHEQNIIQSTVPEVALAEMIHNGQRTINELKPFMNALDFEPDNSWHKNDIEAYFIYEEFIVDPSPMDRISLLFKNDELAAIKHSRPISLNEFESHKIDGGFTLTIIGGLDENEVKELIKERNHFVNSVD